MMTPRAMDIAAQLAAAMQAELPGWELGLSPAIRAVAAPRTDAQVPSTGVVYIWPEAATADVDASGTWEEDVTIHAVLLIPAPLSDEETLRRLWAWCERTFAMIVASPPGQGHVTSGQWGINPDQPASDRTAVGYVTMSVRWHDA